MGQECSTCNYRDGIGIQIWQDGARYEGQWKENKANGKGKFLHVDGDIFEGEWENNKANGKGTYLHANGAKYDGYWKNDLQEGYGIETWADGSRYEGYYKQAKKDGIGVYIWSDGSKYEGDWFENRITGKGIYTWLDKRRYEGEWLNNNMHGKGIYTWQDGRRYEGEYQYDKKHGFGTYYWVDGRQYKGFWQYGKQHGKGKYTLPNGESKIGIWEDGKKKYGLKEKLNQIYNNLFVELSDIKKQFGTFILLNAPMLLQYIYIIPQMYYSAQIGFLIILHVLTNIFFFILSLTDPGIMPKIAVYIDLQGLHIVTHVIIVLKDLIIIVHGQDSVLGKEIIDSFIFFYCFYHFFQLQLYVQIQICQQEIMLNIQLFVQQYQ
ncbi:hypothetical protein IMG5_170870 [Ichthyophthirius multifiliis]|uniref:MORN repeat protein n=1 Tax=Ichthyophthirius multifiliis TaxID=5932 RepID=G0R1J2_ICHMU|nr:hypothetical protein IMG5_170870 [Ichthyophthirius multifiliis]EGR28665.1 hypothetical protein IMG5_170870 [Ichthyophthirius multifiliis]|eukprot:XP_004029901.1 hypothetical protein IMG5_170870 [Ichthyophthirius multifiliis]